MNIALRERYTDARLVETVLDGFRYVKLHTPVISGLRPDTHDKVDTAVGKFCHGDLRGRVRQDAVILADDILQHIPYL